MQGAGEREQTMIEIIQRRNEPGFDNNDTFQNYYQYAETGIDLVLTECGYEKCDPRHYWEGRKGFHVIHVVISGRGTLNMGSASYEIGPGDLFYIPPDRDVTYRADDTDPWEYRWVGFVGTKAMVTLNETVLPQKIFAPVQDMNALAERMQQIYECACQGNDRGDLMALGHMYFFLAELLRECGAQGVNGDAAVDYVHRATDYIREHYAECISVDSICQWLNISRSYLYKLFRRYYGVSPSSYLIHYRLEKARELLNAQQYPVNEVAERVGFSDHPYFTKRFRMVYDMTPREYARRLRKEKMKK